MAPAQPISPTPEEIISARKAVGLTQGQAAAVVYYKDRFWRAIESGATRIHPIIWQVWLIRAGLEKPESIL